MSIEAVLKKRREEFGGRAVTADEAAELPAALPFALPAWLVNLLRNYPLTESEFSLSEDDDASEMGAEIKWLTPAQMISEATECFPGMAAAPIGYLPVGMCLEGSGDPYFININNGENPPPVRIPHEAIDDADALREEEIEIVSPSLSRFFKDAEIN